MNRPLFASLALLIACKHPVDDTDETDVSGPPMRSCDVVVRGTPPESVRLAQVAGSWNGFDPQEMTGPDADGAYALDLGELAPGTYGYKLVWDTTWEDTPPDVYTTWNDGNENRALRVGDCNKPLLDAKSGAANADGTLDAVFAFTRGAGGSELDPASVTVTIAGEPVDASVDEATGEISVHATGLAPGKRSVRVHAVDRDGNAPENGDGFLPLWVEEEPYTWQSGLLYYVFTDRFVDGGPDGKGPVAGTIVGTDYMGGDLVGAKQKLDDGYFDALGVRSIWLSPVNQNPDDGFLGSDGVTTYSGYHGYWPIRGREVEDRLGTTAVPAPDALKAFVDDAHAHGIRVILDSVLNHVHQEHEYVSQHPDWFTAAPCVCTTNPGACNWDTNPISCWFTNYLPDLDYKNQAIVDQSVADLQWWVERYDVDGFRVDAAKHMDHVILRTASMSLRDRYEAAGGAHFWTVGETFTGQGGQGLIMNYVAPYELDGQFDFPLLYPLRDAIGHGAGFRGLSSEVHASDAAYGDHAQWMSVFMGNHDVVRYSTDIAGCQYGWEVFGGCRDVLDEGAPDAITGDEWDLVNKLSMSFLFVATQPGVPLLYYGDEIGLAGSADPDNRRMMRFTDLSQAQQTLLQRFREVGQARRALPALQDGDREELWVDDTLFVYARHDGAGNVAIVAMATAARTQTMPVPADLGLDGKTLHNVLADTRSVDVSGGTATITLNPWEYVILSP